MPRRRLVSDQQVQFTDEGQVMIGTFKGMELVDFQAGERKLNKYTFENEIGIFTIMGTMQIDTALERCKIGEMVEITYKGTVPTSSGFKVKIFEVAVLEEDTDEQG